MPPIVTCVCDDCKKEIFGGPTFGEYWIEDDGTRTGFSHPFEGFFLFAKSKIYSEEEMERRHLVGHMMHDTSKQQSIYIDKDKEEIPDGVEDLGKIDLGIVRCPHCGGSMSIVPWAYC